MKNLSRKIMVLFIGIIFTSVLFLPLTGFAMTKPNNNPPPPPPRDEKKPAIQTEGKQQYTLEQAISDQAQLNTIAFSGLAFLTGTLGADTFFPPGKVADFFGFQYMRDIDANGLGHNTTFLGRAANNVLYILNEAQKAQLISLAKEQEGLYQEFAQHRFPLSKAFRRNLEGDIPKGSSGLSKEAVQKYTAELYQIDAQLSYRRALVVGGIIKSFTAAQKTYLGKMAFGNSATWPDLPEDENLKRSLSHTAHVAVMTYASELFSWYAGSVTADVYFCPERHGTYFGGFYMKDYPAMGNPDYFIPTSLTGDSGEGFLKILTSQQRERITEIIDIQRQDLQEIVTIREKVATQLRKFIQGEAVDQETIYTLVKRYGELDGEMSYYYATRFAQVNQALSTEQKTQLIKLRNQDVFPQGAYLYSEPIAMPAIADTDLLFGK